MSCSSSSIDPVSPGTPKLPVDRASGTPVATRASVLCRCTLARVSIPCPLSDGQRGRRPSGTGRVHPQAIGFPVCSLGIRARSGSRRLAPDTPCHSVPSARVPRIITPPSEEPGGATATPSSSNGRLSAATKAHPGDMQVPERLSGPELQSPPVSPCTKAPVEKWTLSPSRESARPARRRPVLLGDFARSAKRKTARRPRRDRTAAPRSTGQAIEPSPAPTSYPRVAPSHDPP